LDEKCQSKKVPTLAWDQWALDTGLSPGAPVNNCRWASILLVGLVCAFGRKPQATSSKLQAAST